jgi:prolipoprotein diacylglyceryl transferase
VPTFVANIPPPPFNGLQLGPLDLRMYGLLIAIGAFLALRMAVTRYERFGGDPELAEKALLFALLGGFLGARIGYVIPRYERFLEDPVSIIAIWEGGLVLFGGLAGGAAAALWTARRKGGDLPALADAAAPALALAQAIGRWGNYFNQELYGRPTDVVWALEVEEPFRRPGYEAFSTFHPTFLYESLWNLGLVVVLLLVERTGRFKRGSLMFVYLIGYGIGRTWTEALRIDTFERYAGLSRNNWIAIAIVIVGIVGLIWWQRRPTPITDVGTDDDPDAAAPDADADAHTGTEGVTADDDGEEPDAATGDNRGGESVGTDSGDVAPDAPVASEDAAEATDASPDEGPRTSS